MMNESDDKYKITQQLICDLRKRLLDTTPRNPLISFHFKDSSRTHVRVINGLPDELYSQLMDGKTLTFISIPKNEKISSDIILNFDDAQPLDRERKHTGQLTSTSLPTLNKKENFALVECAKIMGINPSFELPLPDRRNMDSAQDSGNKIQTLLFPDQMERNLSGLFNQIRISLSEMGVNTLYCACGFLEWYESDDSDTPILAPLVLLPLQMKRTLVRQTYRYSVESTGDEAEINLTLRERLRQDFAMELPSFDETDTPESYFVKVSEMIQEKARWRVRRFVTIGKFSFSRLVMYQDLDPNRWPAFRPLQEHKVLSDLLGGVDHDEATTAEEYEVDNKDISTKVPVLITNADSSQFSAIADAMTGRNLAIQGPPGTGKSQTITNIIAAALYSNKKVLFLSEKMAALNVVKKRLDDAGIGDFCLELHSTKAQKQNVLDSLKKRLNLKATFFGYTGPIEEDREKLQENLNEYAITMNQPYGETGKTIIEIIWAEQRAREKVMGYKVPDSLWLLEDGSVKNMTMVNLDERLSKLRTIEEVYYLVICNCDSITMHPWYGVDVSNMSIFERDSMIRDFSNWLLAMKQIAEAASKMSSLLEYTDNDMNTTIDSLTNLLMIVKENIFSEKSNMALDILSNFKDQETIQAVEKLILDCQNYKNKYDEFCNYVINPELACGLEISKIDQFNDQIGKLIIRDNINTLEVIDIKTFSGTLRNTSAKVQRCLHLANEWRKLLDYAEPLTTKELQSLLEAIQFLLETPREIIIRRSEELMDELNTHVLERGKTRAYSCIAKLKELEKRFIFNFKDDPQKLRQSAYEIRTAGTLSRFGNNYKKAINSYRFMLRPGVLKPKPVQMVSDYLAIADLLDEINQLNNDAQLKHVAGGDFQGLNTDFAILAAVNQYGIYVCKHFNINTKLEKCIRQFLLDEPAEVLDTISPIANELDIEELKHYVDEYVSNGSFKDMESIYQEYTEATTLVDSFYSYLSAMTVKEHLPIQEISQLAGVIREIENIHSSISRNTQAIQALGNHFKGPYSQIELICTTVSAAKSILATKLPSACIRKLLSSEFNLFCTELVFKANELKKLISKETEIRTNILAFQRVDLTLLFGDLPFEKMKIADILERLQKTVDNSKEFSVWANFCQLRQDTMELGLGQIIDVYLKSDDLPTPLHLADIYEWIFYRSLIKKFYADLPQYKQFSGLDHESIRERFKKIDHAIIQRQQRILAQKLANNPIKAGVGSGLRSKWTNRSLIELELGKKKRHIALRDLFMRASDAILAMKPCFMMSPASVAQFIRPDSKIEFDMVIIDEASQMKPEEALGAIARGRQLIVVGDSKQLPPTAFFDRTDFPDDDEDIEDYIDTESILDLSLSTFRPSRLLNWHYRSRHESLIAFSNKHFYNRSLILFPSPKAKHQDLGVEFRFVNKGVYIGHTNVAEAQEVIAIAKEFMYKYPNKSLGIVTMNINQMELLNAELEQLFSRDHKCEEYRVRWESTLEPLFAKNLENVQGDERDVIFISTLYGPNESGKVMQNFGPVNSVSGARRLNVLFTRAKEKVVIFSSMKSMDIIPTNTSREGVGILKAYLNYAQTGQLESGTESDRPPDSDFEISVGENLRRYGYEVVNQVGVAGYFIDLGVKNPNNPDNYILGIECDGRSYHSAKSARDRDRLRQEVLEAMGWRIYRIWSLDWFQDPEGQMRRLLEYLKVLIEVKSEMTVQYEKDSENISKVEDNRKTWVHEQQTNSAAHLVEKNDRDILEVSKPTQDTAQIESLNTTDTSLIEKVNEHHQRLRLNKEEPSVEIILQKERETPGTWRFKENKDDHPMTIYLTKEQVKELGDPKSIKVTITAAE